MTTSKYKKFLLISIIPRAISDNKALRDLEELKELVETYGGKVTDLITQRREVHDKGSYIGEGKIKETAALLKSNNIDVVVLNAIVKPGQIYEMKRIFQKSKREIEVWDRVDLILQIFSKHANTTEARLQIELAAMRHMGPRIYGMGMELSRQTGGIGTRGIGETNTELMKRHWNEQMKKTKDKLDKLANDRIKQLERRRRVGLLTVSLVGYTNAGKTSLFNLLTKKKKHVADALFVTLDSAVGRVYFSSQKNEVLLSDTIGFIKNLPAELVDAFKSTLMESINADLLLHVIDASDPEIEEKIKIVNKILNKLGIGEKQVIYVFNKIDEVNKKKMAEIKSKLNSEIYEFISVKSEKGIESLLNKLQSSLFNK